MIGRYFQRNSSATNQLFQLHLFLTVLISLADDFSNSVHVIDNTLIIEVQEEKLDRIINRNHWFCLNSSLLAVKLIHSFLFLS